MRVSSLAPLVALALLTAACSKDVTVAAPTIAATDLGSSSKTPGKYAVWIQTGGWNTEVKAAGYTCSAWTFPMALEGGYSSAAQSAFSQSFANVQFVTDTLKPADMKAQGIDAEIIVYQGGLSANFTPVTGFWTASLSASLGIDGTVAVVGPNGLASQGTAKGIANGGSQDSMFASCGDAAEAIAVAGQIALKNFIIDAVNQAKLNVLEMRLKAQTAAAPVTQ